MPDEIQPMPEKAEDETAGVRLESQAVDIGGDVAGRDVIKTTATTTTNVGFSASAVQRLLLAVGGLVFVTAACFFTGGLLVGGALIAALNRPVPVSAAAADAMQTKLDALGALPKGTPFQVSFTEEELNSYWQLVAGPQVGLVPGTGAARLMSDNRVVLAGKFAAAGNLEVAAVLSPQVNLPGQPFQVQQAAVQVVPLGGSSVGWLPVPAAAVQTVTDRVSGMLGPGLELTSVTAPAAGDSPVLAVGGVVR